MLRERFKLYKNLKLKVRIFVENKKVNVVDVVFGSMSVILSLILIYIACAKEGWVYDWVKPSTVSRVLYILYAIFGIAFGINRMFPTLKVLFFEDYFLHIQKFNVEGASGYVTLLDGEEAYFFVPTQEIDGKGMTFLSDVVNEVVVYVNNVEFTFEEVSKLYDFDAVEFKFYYSKDPKDSVVHNIVMGDKEE